MSTRNGRVNDNERGIDTVAKGSVGTSTCGKYSQVFKCYVPFYIIFSAVIVLNVLYYHINNKTTQMIAQIKYI